MNFFRKLLWKLTLKKIYLITCPTLNTLEHIKSLNLIESSKLKLLYDPIIDIKEINNKIYEEINLNNYFLSVGRLTKQKNFCFYVRRLRIIKENKELKLVIAEKGKKKLI